MPRKYIVNDALKELRGSGFEIADGEPDIRGWKVRTTQNLEIGKVDELLFDTVSQRVRYLVVDLKGKPLNLLSRDVLIPIGLAELDEKDNIVYFPEVTVGHFASLPKYKKGKISLETERAIRAVFAPTDGIDYKDPEYRDPNEFYNHEHFDDERMYRSRRRLLEGDDVVADRQEYPGPRKRIVPSTRENVIEEREVERGRKAENEPLKKGSFEPFREGVIEIKEHSEVPVVSKQARVVEEVSVNKEVAEHNEKVKDSVRRTEVDVEKLRKDDLRDR